MGFDSPVVFLWTSLASPGRRAGEGLVGRRCVAAWTDGDRSVLLYPFFPLLGFPDPRRGRNRGSAGGKKGIVTATWTSTSFILVSRRRPDLITRVHRHSYGGAVGWFRPLCRRAGASAATATASRSGTGTSGKRSATWRHYWMQRPGRAWRLFLTQPKSPTFFFGLYVPFVLAFLNENSRSAMCDRIVSKTCAKERVVGRLIGDVWRFGCVGLR